MRRADRLFQIVQLIRGRRLSTAAFLAQRLEVSPRTVYRDVADLQHQGVPIEGEAGVGYRMRAGFDRPPLMINRDEAQALVACVRIARTRLDAQLARDAEAVLSKVLAVLPADTRAQAEKLAIFAIDVRRDDTVRSRIEQLRTAIDDRRVLHVAYVDLKDTRSERRLRPLACYDWGSAWTLAAWCETRGDFRSFRLDRLESIDILDERFRDEPGRTLADLQRRYGME
jgi:predicted DNA-binding transcriptional regulator YafY